MIKIVVGWALQTISSTAVTVVTIADTVARGENNGGKEA